MDAEDETHLRTTSSSLVGVLTSSLVTANSGAIDLGFQRLVAYGVGLVVAVVDADNECNTVQTLDAHPAPVTCVRWSRRPLDTNLDAEYKLTLASGDDKGNVMGK
jgi:hypothetical protein